MSDQALPCPSIRLVSEPALAEMLDVSPKHLHNLRKRRVMPYIMLGSLVRYDLNQVRSALEKLTVRARADAGAESGRAAPVLRFPAA